MPEIKYVQPMKSLSLAVLLQLCLFVACGKPAPFAPAHSPNPWGDDYSSVSAIKDYRDWGPYNVHDPACKKIGDYYYMYSTDAIYRENRRETGENDIRTGNIQMRRSKDLVNWEFIGWAFDEIPREATEWVRSHAGGKGATNIWAPYIIGYNDIYRLYYCVSAFGEKASYIGLAESPSPEGPWTLKGSVVKTNSESVMNAIDPSVIADDKNGKWWMHYGSYFGGLYCVELNPETGLTKTEADQGHLVARRANYRKDNLEAPEIIYNPELDEYFLFTSYDPLMTTYNIRVARSKNPEGPFTSFCGKNINDTTNNFPILTAPYRFDNHTGWAGTGHCGVLRTDEGRYFMFHQARLSPKNQMMVLHVRELFFNSKGWPVASPERYAATPQKRITKEDMSGEWEIMRVAEPLHERLLKAGQILSGEGELATEECNESFHITLSKKGKTDGTGNWHFVPGKQILTITLPGEEVISELIAFVGQDWENEKETILFTGLDGRGRSVWGKKMK